MIEISEIRKLIYDFLTQEGFILGRVSSVELCADHELVVNYSAVNPRGVFVHSKSVFHYDQLYDAQDNPMDMKEVRSRYGWHEISTPGGEELLWALESVVTGSISLPCPDFPVAGQIKDPRRNE